MNLPDDTLLFLRAMAYLVPLSFIAGIVIGLVLCFRETVAETRLLIAHRKLARAIRLGVINGTIKPQT